MTVLDPKDSPSRITERFRLLVKESGLDPHHQEFLTLLMMALIDTGIPVMPRAMRIQPYMDQTSIIWVNFNPPGEWGPRHHIVIKVSPTDFTVEVLLDHGPQYRRHTRNFVRGSRHTTADAIDLVAWALIHLAHTEFI